MEAVSSGDRHNSLQNPGSGSLEADKTRLGAGGLLELLGLPADFPPPPWEVSHRPPPDSHPGRPTQAMAVQTVEAWVAPVEPERSAADRPTPSAGSLAPVVGGPPTRPFAVFVGKMPSDDAGTVRYLKRYVSKQDQQKRRSGKTYERRGSSSSQGSVPHGARHSRKKKERVRSHRRSRSRSRSRSLSSSSSRSAPARPRRRSSSGSPATPPARTVPVARPEAMRRRASSPAASSSAATEDSRKKTALKDRRPLSNRGLEVTLSPAQSSSGASHYSEEGFESVATASIAESVRSRGSVAESVASSAASAVRSEPPPPRATVAPLAAAPTRTPSSKHSPSGSEVSSMPGSAGVQTNSQPRSVDSEPSLQIDSSLVEEEADSVVQSSMGSVIGSNHISPSISGSNVPEESAEGFDNDSIASYRSHVLPSERVASLARRYMEAEKKFRARQAALLEELQDLRKRLRGAEGQGVENLLAEMQRRVGHRRRQQEQQRAVTRRLQAQLQDTGQAGKRAAPHRKGRRRSSSADLSEDISAAPSSLADDVADEVGSVSGLSAPEEVDLSIDEYSDDGPASVADGSAIPSAVGSTVAASVASGSFSASKGSAATSIAESGPAGTYTASFASEVPLDVADDGASPAASVADSVPQSAAASVRDSLAASVADSAIASSNSYARDSAVDDVASGHGSSRSSVMDDVRSSRGSSPRRSGVASSIADDASQDSGIRSSAAGGSIADDFASTRGSSQSAGGSVADDVHSSQSRNGTHSVAASSIPGELSQDDADQYSESAGSILSDPADSLPSSRGSGRSVVDDVGSGSQGGTERSIAASIAEYSADSGWSGPAGDEVAESARHSAIGSTSSLPAEGSVADDGAVPSEPSAGTPADSYSD
eukprot:EG_transcript_1382